MRLHAWVPFLALDIPSLFMSPFPIRQQMPKDFGLGNLSCNMEVDMWPQQVITSFLRVIEQEDALINDIRTARDDMLRITKANSEGVFG